MGFYSWMYADTDNKKRLKIGQGAYVLCPDGTTKIKEYHYNGYGTFGGNDIYELVAEWNRDYLTEDNLIKPLREEYIDNHMRTGQEAFERALKRYEYSWQRLKDFQERQPNSVMSEKYGEDWKREIGISVACYDEQNAALKYPIKICLKANMDYASLPPSRRDPYQGCD